MRVFYLILGLSLLMGCRKKIPKQSFAVEENSEITFYDTVAVDSFSEGAITLDIARKIRRSSLGYQDSLKQIKLKITQEQLAKKNQEELNETKANIKTESTVNP